MILIEEDFEEVLEEIETGKQKVKITSRRLKPEKQKEYDLYIASLEEEKKNKKENIKNKSSVTNADLKDLLLLILEKVGG